ncbi:uncharacterized protein BDW70DRAFT_166539 [Aspergillus foveolatus]|uniref:uncharacterized protein n=1 Tax=Aspergillus foveolatus TaxID=210207 RepID=UPI003CCCBEAC
MVFWPMGSGRNSPRKKVSTDFLRGMLSESERLDYIDALHCLQSKPPILPRDQYPGVRHRMDDFSASDCLAKCTRHLFGWHRHFVLWEKALQGECVYRGHQPYWDWALSADNISASPIFDGSPTSLSGDGDPIPQDPFFKLLFTSQRDVDRLLKSHSITELQIYIDFSDWPELGKAGIMGPHAVAHMQLGRTMDDFWTAPQDLSFFLHRAQVDRVWTLWQNSIHNAPRTPEVTLDTELHFGWLDPSRTLKEMMSTEDYHLCYKYGS